MNKLEKVLASLLLEESAPQQARTLLNDQEAQAKYARMRTLVRAAQAPDHLEAPSRITTTVMSRIASEQPLKKPLSLQALSAQGLAYVFFAFALFYCLIGVFMHIALTDAAAAELPGWIWRQPRIALLSALLFALCGLLLLKRGRRAAKLLYATLLAYMLCLAANALQAQLSAGIPMLTLGLAGFVSGGLAICLFLGDMLRKLPKNGWHNTKGA